MKDVGTPFNAPIIVTDINSAELIKHACNSFLALKISYTNALSVICEASGANISDVVHGMGLDKRIGRAFLNAGLGYGGSCFPKDLSAFIHIAETLGYDFRLLKEVQQINTDQIEHFLKKIHDTLWIVKDKTIGVLGLAFKPNTDDMRLAPSLEIIRPLQKEGAKIRAYDPKAMEKAREVLPGVEFCADAYAVAAGADALIICTERDEFRLHLGPRQYIAFGEVRQHEAAAATALFGLTRDQLNFLGYPDHGTLQIWRDYWGETRPFRSDATRTNAVPYPDAFGYGHLYKPESVVADFVELFQRIRPTKVFVTHPADTNPDHRAAANFGRLAV